MGTNGTGPKLQDEGLEKENHAEARAWAFYFFPPGFSLSLLLFFLGGRRFELKALGLTLPYNHFAT